VRAESLHMDRQKDGRTDGQDEANNRFSQLCERAQETETYTHLIDINNFNVRFKYVTV
jgi:hypothetical protein